jgi:hypothetical protein
MLVSFSVTNFRSFAAEQVFSLVASKRLGSTHPDHMHPIPGSDERVLRTGVIYGANGAGKSNLLKALRYARQVALVAREQARGTGRTPFRFSDLRDQPSTFDLQFLTRGKLYRFGFSVDDERILEEWLTEEQSGLIYQRSTDSSGKVEIDAPGLKHVSARLAALVTVGGPHDQSFLATVRATLEPQDFGTTLTAVIEWLHSGLTLIGPQWTSSALDERLASDPRFCQFASDFLRASSTGVDHLRVDKTELSQDKLGALGLSPTRVSNLLSPDLPSAAVSWPKGDLTIERSADRDRVYQVAIRAVHQHETGEGTDLDPTEESDGTQRLLALLPALYRMKVDSAVFFIDEIDRSMHPMLVHKVIQYFLNTRTAAPCQIIVTTHETHLLDLELLRRDEIWFAEKDTIGASHLYSLTDFQVRKDLRLEKGYLQGRFGAVPFLGDIDRLVERGTEREHASAG